MGTSEVELRNEAQAQRERLGSTLEAIGDRVSPERVVERRKAAVSQGFRKARDTVMGSRDYEEPRLAHMKDRAGEAMGAAAERVQHTPEMLADQTRGNPLAAGLVVFGAGMLLATIFPETRTEQRLVDAAQPPLQHAAEELKGAGRELAQDARQVGQEATQHVREAGSEAAATVKQETQQSADSVRREVERS
jgi:hypothetical protein